MPNIRHEVLIGASADTVFDAFTTQEGLSGWWTPDVKAQAEVGSLARFAFGPDYYKEMQIVELSATQRVEWKCLVGTSEWVDTTISFELRSSSIVSIRASSPEAEDQINQGKSSSNLTLLMMCMITGADTRQCLRSAATPARNSLET